MFISITFNTSHQPFILEIRSTITELLNENIKYNPRRATGKARKGKPGIRADGTTQTTYSPIGFLSNFDTTILKTRLVNTHDDIIPDTKRQDSGRKH